MAGGTGYFWGGASQGISEGIDWHRKIFDLKEKKRAREDLDEHKKKVASHMTEAAKILDEYHKIGGLTEEQERSLYASFHGLTTEVQQQYYPAFQNIVDGNYSKLNEQKEMISLFFDELMPMLGSLEEMGNLDAVLGLINNYITHPEARRYLDVNMDMARELQSVRDLMADEKYAKFNNMMQGMEIHEVKVVDGKETITYKPKGSIDLEEALYLKSQAEAFGYNLKITSDGKWELKEEDVPKSVFEGYMKDPQATIGFMDEQAKATARYKTTSSAEDKPRDFGKDINLASHIAGEINVEDGAEAYVEALDRYEASGYDIPAYMKTTQHYAKMVRDEYSEAISKLRTYASHIESGTEYDADGYRLDTLYIEYTNKAKKLIKLIKELDGVDIEFPLKTLEEYIKSTKGAGWFGRDKKGTFEK